MSKGRKSTLDQSAFNGLAMLNNMVEKKETAVKKADEKEKAERKAKYLETAYLCLRDRKYIVSYSSKNEDGTETQKTQVNNLKPVNVSGKKGTAANCAMQRVMKLVLQYDQPIVDIHKNTRGEDKLSAPQWIEKFFLDLAGDNPEKLEDVKGAFSSVCGKLTEDQKSALFPNVFGKVEAPVSKVA